MPSHSKHSKIAYLIRSQEEVLRFHLGNVKPLLHTLKAIGLGKGKNNFKLSYEALKCYQGFYNGIVIVLGKQKATILADNLFTNSYPKRKEHRLFVDYYAAVLKTL